MSTNHDKSKVAKAVVHFAGHTAAGAIIFAIIAFVTVVLSGIIYACAALPWMSKFSLDVLEVLEHAMMIGDAILFACHLLVGAYRSIVELKED
ncbi:hypothetical protein [Herbaspirillum huttiense]|uniref:hypothetical protein n=1 Tax=Herbaspirillum huttiense TaxID=863372 RepID=UPI0039B12916